MKLTRDSLRRLIIKEMISEQGELIGSDPSEALSTGQVGALIDAGIDVAGVNSGNLTDEMLAVLNQVNLLPPDALPPSDGDYWYDGQKLSLLISDLQKMMEEHGDLPVRTFIGDGADLEADASSAFSHREPDDDNKHLIDEPMITIVVDR